MGSRVRMETREKNDIFELSPCRSDGPLSKLHRSAESTIALDLQVPAGRVHKLYCLVLKRLSSNARIFDYLPILTSKRVKDLLRKRLTLKNRLLSN